MPLIEDHGELETAIRFQAQDHIPMPLEQAVLDWQVVGHATGANGERQVEVVAVAARRDMLGGLMQALSRAGLRPVGIDLSAFGMIRALARESYAPVEPGGYVDAPGSGAAVRTSSGSPGTLRGEGSAAGESAPRGARPRAGSTATSATSRTSRWPAARPACSLASRRSASRGSPRSSPSGDSSPSSTPASGLSTWAWSSRSRGSRATRETIAGAREALAEGAARLVDELRLSLEYYAAQEGAVPIEGVVACGPGTTIPGLAQRLQRDLGQRFEIGRPRALAHLDEAAAARLTLSFGLALEE